MPRILAVQTDDAGKPIVIMAADPSELGMIAVRLDQKERVLYERVRELSADRKPGQWFRHETGGPIVLSCHKCAAPARVDPVNQRVMIDGRLEQPQPCGECNATDMVQLSDFDRVVAGACPTCAHGEHLGKDPCGCGCTDGGQDPQPVWGLERVVQGRIVLPSELSAAAKQIAEETMRATAKHARQPLRLVPR